ncbi:MAG: NAD(P)/FAD-dependent oxidoreductase [Chromatiales bacterium]|nr:NAD(P)/FAD-dependent oxidoreductase [Chromatiales bacterium]
MAESVGTVVIGAGVVGLAVARALAMAGHEVIVLEGEDAIGTHTSSRNSEVIHAGIYYTPGSRKALTCVRGKQLLYEYCECHGVPHKRITKLIVAVSDDQGEELERIKANAARNGVDDLETLDAKQAARLEPYVRARCALLSPSTGIIDTHSLMLAYQGDAQEHGAMIAFHSQFIRARVVNEGVEVDVDTDGDTMTLRAQTVINCAGLFAPQVAAQISGLDQTHVPTAYYAKGNYFTLLGKAPFSRLIYPLPEPGGLGVHVTLDLGGGARFGPDVEWLEDIDYDVDAARADRFYPAVRTWFPELEDGSLTPGYAGIRPKISAQGEPAADFVIEGPQQHGVAGLVNLFGIESPGVTASLAIADEVAAMVKDTQ